MDTLSQFLNQDAEVPTLKDFNTNNTVNSTPSSNDMSNMNYAVNVASLSGPNSPIDTYRGTLSQLQDNGTSPTSDLVQQAVNEHRQASSRDAVVNFLSSPSNSSEDKEILATNYLNSKLKPSIVNSVSEEALISPSIGENKEGEDLRINTASILDKVNEQKRSEQSFINRAKVSSDPSMFNKTMSFVELLAPFTEEGQLASIVNDWKNQGEEGPSAVKTIGLLGEARQEIRDSMLRLPPEKRMEAMEKFISVINSHSGIVLTDDNDFTRANNIKAFFEDNGYSTWDRIVDDATSLLDMSVIGSPIAKVLSKVNKSSREVKEVKEAIDTSNLPITDITNFDPHARAISDYNSELSLEQATKFSGVIKDSVGEDAAKTYLDTFKNAFNNPDNVVGVGDNVPAFFNMESKAKKDSVRSDVQPASISQNYKDVNPQKSAAVHELAASDETGEAAKVLYGAYRTEAVASDVLPEIGNGGVVKNKTGSIDRLVVDKDTPPLEVSNFVDNLGMNYYFQEEKMGQREVVVNDFKNGLGLHARNEMFSYEAVPDGVNIHAVYGPKENGFGTVSDAINTAEFSLRDYGVTPDQISVLIRDGSNYVPVKDISSVMRKKDFLIQVDHHYSFNPADITEHQNWVNADVKRNWFDYIRPISKGTHGTLQSLIIDAHSMLNPVLTRGANRAVDFGAGLEKTLSDVGNKFTKGFSSLSQNRKDELIKYIKDANERGLENDTTLLKAKGFNDNEINILNNWKNTWDNIYWLENRDLGITLKNKGWGFFIDKGSDTQLLVKPLVRQKISSGLDIYDQTTNTVRYLSPKEISALYKEGSVVAELKTPIKIGDDVATHVISKEQKGTSFVRSITENERVLNYRSGYYHVHYKDPYFVEKIIKDKNGVEIKRQAVATTNSLKDAKTIQQRLLALDSNGNSYNIRGDVKNFNIDNDSYWDLQVSRGRTSQRLRGKRLEDATSSISSPGHENILDPMEALTKSIRSVSRRVSMREYLDATKERFINQYKDILPKNNYKETIFPSSRQDIGGPGVLVNKQIADARTTYEYIRALEGGYVNSIDDFYKATLNSVAEVLGEHDANKAALIGEKILRGVAEGRGPTNSVKNLAFQAYLALNPLRQCILQGHQAVRLLPLFPKYVGSGQMLADVRLLTYRLRGIPVSTKTLKGANLTKEALDKMTEEFKKTGFLAAVDANNLTRMDALSLADMSLAGRIKSTLSYPFKLSQKIGFDAGENFNMMTAWLCFRQDAINKGLKLDAETLDNIAAKARNITYNMNRAGDMPYNRNELGMFFQFMQVPHKALLQDFFNRDLPIKDRVKLLAFDLAMWGIGPVTAIPGINSALNNISDPDKRRIITNGLEEQIINKVLSLSTGNKTALDFSDIAPGSYTSFMDTLTSTWTTGLGDLVSKTPSGQLLAGGNPRITNAFRTAARYFNLIDDYEKPTSLYQVAKSFAGIASGFSNAFQASYILKYGQKVNSSDIVVADNLTTTEAVAQLFGIKTIKEAQQYQVTQDIYNNSNKIEQDFNIWYKGLIKNLNDESLTPRQTEWVTRVYSEAFRAWGNGNPKIRELVSSAINKSIVEKDHTVFNSLTKVLGSIPRETWRQEVLDSGLNEKDKKVLFDIGDMTKDSK